MNIHQQEQKFLDYLEGTLSPEESAALKAELERSSELKRSFEKYRAVVETEKMIAGESLELHPNFTVKVLNKIENQPVGALGRVAAAIRRNSVALISSAATLATLILVVRVSDDYSERQFAPASPSESKAVAPVQQKEESSLPSAAVRNEIDAVKALPPAEESQKLKRSLQADLKAPPEGIEKFGFDGEPQRLDSKDNVPSLISPKKSMPVIPAPASKPDEGRAVAGKGVGSVSSGSSFLFEGNAGSAPAKTEQNAASRVYDDRKSQSLEVADLMGAPAGGAKQRVQEELSDEVYRRRETDERTAEIYSRVMERFKELKKEEESKISALPLGPIPAAEQYRTYEENKRLNVASVPSSTFSIDVDTASYTNARRQLLQGVMPPRDSIRIEEFINYFDYDYPAEFEKPFGLSYEIAPSPLESDRYLLRLGIKAKDVSHSPKPWNLVFLIDVSGSMADGNKLPLVKKALRLVVDRMKSSDKIAIVTYSGEARVALESSSADDKAKIISVIDSLSAGGSTNGSGGINAAYSLAERAKIEGGVNRVILATDGDFNVGTTSFDELIKLIENQRRSGVTLTTLGFGYGNLKDGTLEQLANKGNGNYFYIDTFSEARRIFEEQLLGTLEVVAKDVKLQVEFNPTKVASYRLIGYENRNLRREDFNNDAVDAGEVGSGHKVTALYELVLKGSPLEAKLADNYRYQEAERGTKAVAIGERYTNEMGYLKIRYKEPDGSESKLLEFPLEAAKVKESAAEASSDFRFAAAVSYFAHLLRDSQYKGNYSFKEVQKLAESAQGSDRSGHRREFVELVKNAAAIARR